MPVGKYKPNGAGAEPVPDVPDVKGEVEINDFQTLLEAARAQEDPQQFLFVFARTELPDDHDGQQAENFSAGQGGALVPIMYVDKAREDLTTFEDLVTESQQMSDNWQVVVVAIIGGLYGQPPSPDQVDDAFNNLIGKLKAGSDISQLMAFDRNGEPLQFV